MELLEYFAMFFLCFLLAMLIYNRLVRNNVPIVANAIEGS
jgi:hypothetical protein